MFRTECFKLGIGDFRGRHPEGTGDRHPMDRSLIEVFTLADTAHIELAGRNIDQLYQGCLTLDRDGIATEAANQPLTKEMLMFHGNGIY